MAKKFPKPSELKKKKSEKPAPPEPEPEEIEEDELEDEREDENEDTDAEDTTGDDRKMISWNQRQDDALILSLASGASSIEEVAEALKIHPAFKEFSGLVTEKKVSTRIIFLRKILKAKGVELPRMKPRKAARYQPDAERLIRLLQGKE